jgi:hypothetical protein
VVVPMNIHRRHLDEFQRAGDWSVDKLARRISQERKEKTLFTSDTSRCSDNTDQEVKVEEDERGIHTLQEVYVFEKKRKIRLKRGKFGRPGCVNRSRPSRTKTGGLLAEKSMILLSKLGPLCV